MSSESVLEYSLDSIRDRLVVEGVEKRVYKIVEDNIPYAMKIYKSIKPGNKSVDRDFEARRELEAYYYLKKTPIKDLIPTPVRLVETQLGRAIGMVLEWKEGRSVESMGTVLNQFQIADLEERLNSLPDFGVIANADMYSEGNLMVNGSELWLAECQITPHKGNTNSIELYKNMVHKQMEYLRTHYAVD